MPKPEIEFSLLEDVKWKPVKEHPTGIEQKILSEDPETKNSTRLLRFKPGVETKEILRHDFWEEVYILRGGLIDLRKEDTYVKGAYACRPPGMKHGPYRAPVGCVTLEIRYKPY